jgi:hypothetical protein
VIVLALLNLGVYLSAVVGRAAESPVTKYGNDLMRQTYPGWDPVEIDRLMAESYQPLVFESFTHFKDRPTRGRYVNVDPQGFRWVQRQGPWPPPPDGFTIFFFGGSTAFGYGLPDDQTIASYLQQAMASRRPGQRTFVYNFGRGYYISAQERIALEQLLTAGYVPNFTVFLDGLNDFLLPDGEPEGAARLAALMQGDGTARSAWLNDWAVARAVRRAVETLGGPGGSGAIGGTRRESPADRDLAYRVIRRWLANKEILEAIAERFGFGVLFVWQPAAAYGFDPAHHPFFDAGSPAKYRLLRLGYGILRDEIGLASLPNVLWLADMQRGRQDLLYVDQVHYGARFSREIAERIAARLPLEAPARARRPGTSGK